MNHGLSNCTVLTPCSCGELVQGTLDGQPFLVSCPIDRYSQVTVTLLPEPPGGIPALGDGRHSKAMAGAEAALAYLGMSGTPFRLELSRPLPPSRGFGTSTADVVGAIVAAAGAAGHHLQPEEVASLSVSVEPSDSTMFPGLALLDHRGGSRWEPLGPAPSLLVAVLEFGGAVDTVSYNRGLNLAVLRGMGRDHARAVELLRRGLREGRLDMIGLATTLSACLNQGLLPKPYLEAAIELAGRHQGLGVCAAHSGTVLGVLFPPGAARAARRLLAAAGGSLPGLESGWLAEMVGGGARLLDHGLRIVGRGGGIEPAALRLVSTTGIEEKR